MKQQPGLSRFGVRVRAAIGGALAIGCASLSVAGPAGTKDDPPAAAAKITTEQATAIALKVMPGRSTGVTIEKKKGKMVYVVEIQTETRGERDVFIDMVSGKVVGTD